MKRTAFDAGTCNSGIQEPQVKMCIVCNDNRALAADLAQFLADFAKHALQGIAFRNRRTQRVMRIDAGHFQ